MAKKKLDHVIKRDGSAGLGEPRPRPAPRPSKPQVDEGYFRGSGDPDGTKGSFPIGATATVSIEGRSAECGKVGFEALPHGAASPRQKAMRGEDPGGSHTEPGEEAKIGLANPLD